MTERHAPAPAADAMSIRRILMGDVLAHHLRLPSAIVEVASSPCQEPPRFMHGI